jgi:hypothetical protein
MMVSVRKPAVRGTPTGKSKRPRGTAKNKSARNPAVRGTPTGKSKRPRGTAKNKSARNPAVRGEPTGKSNSKRLRGTAKNKSHLTKEKCKWGDFNEDSYYSNDGFLTTVWGPSMWFMLHTVSFNYPCDPSDNVQTQYQQFFDSLQHVLPCGKCRTNLVGNFKCTGYGKAVFKSRATLSRWVYDLHSCVNKMLNKPNPYTYDETRNRYENFRARCRKDEPTRKSTSKVKENGCTDPVSGLKSKCTLKIEPLADCDCESMQIDPRCICKKVGYNG